MLLYFVKRAQNSKTNMIPAFKPSLTMHRKYLIKIGRMRMQLKVTQTEMIVLNQKDDL